MATKTTKTTKREPKSPNSHSALLMKRVNVTSGYLKRIDEVGDEAVRSIGLLIPPADKVEDCYMTFPNNGAIKMPHPITGESVEVSRIYLSDRYDICIEWYGKEKDKDLSRKDVIILDHYGAMDCVRLLDSILIAYGKN